MPLSDCFVSVVAPLRDDEDIVTSFVEETMAMLRSNYTNYELVLVDDGSPDETLKTVSALLSRHDCMRLVPLSRRFGQEIAISAGLETVIGDFVVVMLPDSDPPSLVPEMVDRARQGSAIVFGIRSQRKGEPIWLRGGASLFYWSVNRLLGLNLPKNSTHFRALSREAVNALLQVRDQMRYLRTLSAHVGYTRQAFEYEPIQRRARPRRKGLWEALSLAGSIVVANTTRPLRIVSWVGLLAAGLNVLYMGYVVLIYLLKDQVAEGWVTQSMQSSGMFFLLFLVLAVLSEYVGRILSETRDRPLYFARREQVSSVLITDDERKNVVDESVESTAPGRGRSDT